VGARGGNKGRKFDTDYSKDLNTEKATDITKLEDHLEEKKDK
jgi:hypothetical protein